MKRITLYSSSRSTAARKTASAGEPRLPEGFQQNQTQNAPTVPAPNRQARSRWRNLCARHERPLWVGAAVLLALLVVLTHAWIMPAPRQITQQDINAAVLHTLETEGLPSPAAKAYEAIRPSVVRVRRM